MALPLAAASSRRTATACRSPTRRRSSRCTRATRRSSTRRACRSTSVRACTLKVEGANPTGSFKDRGMTVAMSKAAEEGAKVVVCASTGNTSASAAAYAARAGMLAAVIIPDGHVALGKLAQALIHGAKVVSDPRQLRRRAARSCASWASGAASPSSTRSTRTASRARRPPRSRSATRSATRPTCTASRSATPGNITAYWRGYSEYARDGIVTKTSRACSAGRPRVRRRSCTASRCRIPRRSRPRSGSATRRVGTARSPPATSRAARSARSPTPRSSTRTAARVARKACSSSRLRRRRSPDCSRRATRGLVERGETIVCTVTGHGLKDPNRAIAEIEAAAAPSTRPSTRCWRSSAL